MRRDFSSATGSKPLSRPMVAYLRMTDSVGTSHVPFFSVKAAPSSPRSVPCFDGIDACPNGGPNTILRFRMSHHEFVHPVCHLYGSTHLLFAGELDLKFKPE